VLCFRPYLLRYSSVQRSICFLCFTLYVYRKLLCPESFEKYFEWTTTQYNMYKLRLWRLDATDQDKSNKFVCCFFHSSQIFSSPRPRDVYTTPLHRSLESNPFTNNCLPKTDVDLCRLTPLVVFCSKRKSRVLLFFRLT
jgi:hypothetical protein